VVGGGGGDKSSGWVDRIVKDEWGSGVVAVGGRCRVKCFYESDDGPGKSRSPRIYRHGCG
jgi:hypothetical protein